MVKHLIIATLLILSLAGHTSAYRPMQFSIQVSGTTDSEIEFSGWCAIEIGNRTLQRSEFRGSGREMKPVVVYGRYIDSCETRVLSGQGSITLVLHADDKEIFRRTTREGETSLQYGPTMNRYSTRPPTMQ